MFMSDLGHEGFRVSSIVFDIENYLEYKTSINSQKVFSAKIKNKTEDQALVIVCQLMADNLLSGLYETQGYAN